MFYFTGICGHSAVQDSEEDAYRDTQAVCYRQDPPVLYAKGEIRPAVLPRQIRHDSQRFPQTGCK